MRKRKKAAACSREIDPGMGFVNRSKTKVPYKARLAQGLVEYALILVLIAIVIIIVLASIGTGIGNIFSSIVHTV
jgi:pilus assembly protein Flp/PilA